MQTATKPTLPAAITQDAQLASTSKKHKQVRESAPVAKQALTRKQFAAEYSISEQSIYRWEKLGLKFSKLMRTRLYMRRDIEAFISAHI